MGSMMENNNDPVRQAQWHAIGHISGCIAHDLRNPLGVIRNAAYLLRRGLGARQREQELLATIEDEVKTANSVVTRVADMISSRELTLEQVDLAIMIPDVAAEVDSQRRVNWSFSFGVRPLTVTCDAAQIRNVLYQLLRNALEATNASGEVSVIAQQNDQCSTIDISDSGPGFMPEIQTRLFEPLNTNKRSAMGMGLAMCRLVMQRHGGDVVVQHPGPRALVRVMLPRSPRR